ncbi:MAG: ABC transporter ATP-binding protein/permease, partial [Chitinophagales bacterium]|nr:ABC transporter ATP-binding protein/permease [Chitinophagales bacterium]
LEIIFREPVNIAVFLAAMVMMSFELTLFVFIMLLVTGGIIGRIGKKLKQTSGIGQEKLGMLISIAEETIGGLRIIQGFGSEKYKAEQFKKINQSYFNLAHRLTLRRELSSPLTEFLAICVICVVLWFGGKLVLKQQMITAETFIGFMVIFSQLIPPAKSFSNAFYNIQKGLASSKRIYEILDTQSEISESPDAVPINGFHKEIEFRDVSFSYGKNDDKETLRQINLRISKGKIIALVGQSGAGKSTLVDLLPRFYDPQRGEILIDGINIKKITLQSLRSLFGIVSQEAILFNDTVYNNIAFGCADATMDKVVAAAKAANAHDFIMQLENGYNTNIGERGNKLSGGEKQRLTIARAILRNPPILILDEATSSLDSGSEKLVQEALNKLMKGRTAIIIAHRLSTIQYADEILVMKNGEIVERGNHIGLMAHNGLYKELVELQAF